MKKEIRVKFDYRDGDAKKAPVKTYDKPIEFPETCPVSFFAVAQFATHVHWEEKRALKARIEELEKQLEAKNEKN